MKIEAKHVVIAAGLAALWWYCKKPGFDKGLPPKKSPPPPDYTVDAPSAAYSSPSYSPPIIKVSKVPLRQATVEATNPWIMIN